MRLNYETTLHLSVEDIKKILTQHLREKENLDTLKIQFDIVTETCGYGPTEYECTNLKGATIRVDQVDKVPQTTARETS